MADLEKLTRTLEGLDDTVRCFDTAAQAADYLDSRINGKSVAFGGSMTLKALDLYPRLSTHTKVLWHWEGSSRLEAATTQVYLSSVNALAETGELVNIDGVGNRVASTLFGHEEVYFVVGTNKITPDYDSALWRARNVAAPKRAQSQNRKTPCALKGDKCYNCKSPDRICKALSVLWGKPISLPVMEIVLIDEDLGM